MDSFWDMYKLPIQRDFLDVEEINPIEAFRRQADAINFAGPLYAELEVLDARMYRVSKIYKELRDRVLSQNMPVPSSSTRTTDLVDAFILKCSHEFVTSNGEIKDISNNLLKLFRRKCKLEFKINRIERRLRALESMADKCDRVMNWAKFQARTELILTK